MRTEPWVELMTLAAIQSCMLVLLVLVIRAPVARWLGARWAYYLWLAPLTGLLALLLAGDPLKRYFGLPQLAVPATGELFQLAGSAPTLVLCAWLSGFVLSLSWFVAGSARFAIRLRRSSRDLTYEERALVRERCARLARRVDVDFRLLASGQGPAVAGLLQPTLLLPLDFFERYSARQQTLMLSHELQHLCRRDLFALFLARLYRCIFWFNPLAWIAEKFVQLDQELSCDERVLSRENTAGRRAYGEAMLLAVHASLVPGQAGYPGPFEQVRKRAAYLPFHNRRLLGSALGASLVIAVSGGSVVFGALAAVERDLGVRPEVRSFLAESAVQLASDGASRGTLRRLPASLVQLESERFNPPLNDRERALIASQSARAWFRLGYYDRALQTYQRAVKLAVAMPDLEARALLGMADALVARGDFVDALKAMVRSESLDPSQYAPETWVLRGLALAKLKQWDQALICLNRAIAQAEASARPPDERWLLTQAALRLNTGDLDGAARSLDAAIEHHPQTPFQDRLEIFSRLAEDHWEPQLEKPIAASY